MSFVEIIVLAVALAMDAVAVSLTQGMAARRPTMAESAVMAGAFGLFQGLMPVLGWLLSSLFADQVQAAAPWIAFTLLAIIGGRMIWEALETDNDNGNGNEAADDKDDKAADGTPGLGRILTLAVATSIDAFAVGVTFAVLDVAVAPAVVVIGVVTFALSLVAVRIGARAGAYLGGRAELIGGLVLVGIGLRIIGDHLGLI